MLADIAPDLRLGGVDIDGCLDAEGKLAEWAVPIVDLLGGTYCERSPSGRGLHLLFLFSPSQQLDILRWPASYKRHDEVTGKDYGFELYVKGTGRYFTLTGDRYGR